METHRNVASRGATLVELVVALTVVAISMVVVIQQAALGQRELGVQEDRVFATHKAMALLSELQVGIDQGRIVDGDGLSALADTEPNPVLTTRVGVDGAPLPPDNPMSGNVQLPSQQWKYMRELRFEAGAGADTMRFARVLLHRRSNTGQSVVEASVGGVLNLRVAGFPTVQQYDVYVLALAAVPSLWQPLPSLRAQFEGAAEKICQDNPGLRYRLHWITELGYGRDALYTPFVNEGVPADAAAPFVYWYPGLLGTGASVSRLFAADAFGGRVRTESRVLHDYDAGSNPLPHAVADRFNHCMRLPAARALFEQKIAAGLARRDEPPAPRQAQAQARASTACAPAAKWSRSPARSFRRMSARVRVCCAGGARASRATKPRPRHRYRPTASRPRRSHTGSR